METIVGIDKVQNGRFNDGVEEKTPADARKRGDYFYKIMKLNGVTEDEVDFRICCDCGERHERQAKRCMSCHQIRKDRIARERKEQLARRM